MSEGKKTVLIADDSLMIRNLLSSNLEKDYIVIATEDGLKAVQAFGSMEDGIDLIILDYEMPNLDGLKALQVIRSKSKDVPVIMLSGTLDKKRVENLTKHGASRIFAKPVDLIKLSAEMKELLRVKEIRKGGGVADDDLKEEEDSNGKI